MSRSADAICRRLARVGVDIGFHRESATLVVTTAVPIRPTIFSILENMVGRLRVITYREMSTTRTGLAYTAELSDQLLRRLGRQSDSCAI